MTASQKPIVVVGSINMDLVTSTPRIPLAGETLIGTNFTTTPGGKGANQAVAAARLGFPVQMIGAVGEDMFGEALLENLRQSGAGTEAVARVSGASGVAPILVAANGENSIVVVSGANGKVTPELIDRHADLIAAAGMVLCQLEIPMPSLSHALEVCAKAGVPVVLDPAPAADLPEKVWSQVTWFTPNETEAARYVGEYLPAEHAAIRLLARGVRGVVLKRGSEGAYVSVAGGEAKWVPAFPVDAIDTVAAGDCFNGAFAVSLLEGRDPWDAARFAAAAAAISVTRSGAQTSMPSRAEVDSFLRQRG
jgi:ribokinase